MRAHHVVALIGCAGLSGIALTDAFVQATTGHNSIFADDSGRLGAIVTGDIWHGLTYAALAWVLIAEAARFAGATTVARICRPVLVVCLLASAISFTVVVPALLLTGSMDGAFAAVFGALGTPIFAGTILGAIVLGLALLRNNPVGIGGRVLAGILPVTAVVVALAFLAPAYAHPGYVETVVNVGLALVGVGAARPVAAGSGARTEVSPSSSRR